MDTIAFIFLLPYERNCVLSYGFFTEIPVLSKGENTLYLVVDTSLFEDGNLFAVNGAGIFHYFVKIVHNTVSSVLLENT